MITAFFDALVLIQFFIVKKAFPLKLVLPEVGDPRIDIFMF
jgi:hypothetical protein